MLLCHRDLQLHLVAVAGRQFPELGQVNGDLLGAEAEDAADTHNEGFDLPALIKQDVDNVSDLLVV